MGSRASPVATSRSTSRPSRSGRRFARPRTRCRRAVDGGWLEVWTSLPFDRSSDPKGPRDTNVDPKRVPVAVPCTELSRPQYSTTAGNAGVLVKGKTYVITIEYPRADDRWGKKLAWPATKIDNAP